MRSKKTAIIFITVLTISMLIGGCGKKDNGENKNSEGIQTESEIGTENIGTEETGTEEQVHTCDYVTVASDETNHWYVCSCGNTANSAAHTYDNDTDATCDACGFTRNVHICAHTTLASDGNNHWYVCSCGSTANVAAHNYDNDTDANCNTCGFTRNVHVCDYSILESDENNHWYACSCGSKESPVPHNFNSDYDPSCNSCNYIRVVSKVPDYSMFTCRYTTINYDENGHWATCDCGKSTRPTFHNYDNLADATCNSCSYVREITGNPEDGVDTSNTVSWNGGDIVLHYAGVMIPTLTEFNRIGISSTDQNLWWTGYENDKAALSAMNRIYLTCDEFGEGLAAQGISIQSINGFTVSQGSLWFAWGSGTDMDFFLRRDASEGYYTLEIKRDLRDCRYFGTQIAPWNQDVVRAMLSFITSDPEAVFDYIYTGTYENGKILNTKYFKPIADCQIRLDPSYGFKDGYCYIKFYIAPLDN